MLFAGQDFADNHLREWRRSGRHLFDLEPGHGERVRKLLCRQRRITETAEPGFGKLHGVLGVNVEISMFVEALLHMAWTVIFAKVDFY